MALGNIHEWADDEIITHDDLNSIAEAVSQEIGSGSIPATSLLWPLVAQGTLDMNGNSIENINQFLNVYHVNSDLTLASAVTNVNADGGGAICIDPGFTAAASELVVSANDVHIYGVGYDSAISVTGSTFGIKFTGDRCSISNLKFTGSGTGVDLLFSNNANIRVQDNKFYNLSGTNLQLGDATGGSVRAIVTGNDFRGAVGLNFYNGYAHSISGNIFASNTTAGMLYANTGNLFFTTFTGNVFHAATIAVDFTYTAGGTTTSRGFNTFSGNTFYDTGADTDCFILEGFFKCSVVGNAFLSAQNISITGSHNIFSGNNVYTSAIDISGSSCIISNNVFQGSLSSTGGSALSVTGNYFQNGVELVTAFEKFVGNTIDGTVTETGLPTVYGLNVGW